LTLTDTDLYQALCVTIALLGAIYLLTWVVRRLKRSREGLDIGRQVAIAFGLRWLAAVALGQLSIARDLRGGDELRFMSDAKDIAAQSLSSPDSVDALTSQFHTFWFSLHFRVLDGAPPELLLRTEMVLFSTVGLALSAFNFCESSNACET